MPLLWQPIGGGEAGPEPVRHVPKPSGSARERWGALPMGELHPEDRCALCGDTRAAKRRTVILSTHAIGYRCLDDVACLKRKRKAQR